LSYATKVYREIGGDKLTVAPGGAINFGNATFSVNTAGKLVLAFPQPIRMSKVSFGRMAAHYLLVPVRLDPHRKLSR
jgi:hypothetical protein